MCTIQVTWLQRTCALKGKQLKTVDSTQCGRRDLWLKIETLEPDYIDLKHPQTFTPWSPTALIYLRYITHLELESCENQS